MKIDRVFFCLNNNPLYTGFWNVVSKVYLKAFNITPTLVFYGEKYEAVSLNLSEDYGEITCIPRLKNFTINHNREWYVPLTLFFAAAKYSNEVCMTSGIDQIPLSDLFLKEIEKYDDNKYVVAFSDAYKEPFYPSSHHVAKGSLFKKVHNVSDNFEHEIEKALSCKNDPSLPNDLWGLDERYTSKMLDSFDKDAIILVKNFFYERWVPRRLDRSTILQTGYSTDLASNKAYSEFHSVRPYEVYKSIIDKLIFDVYGF